MYRKYIEDIKYCIKNFDIDKSHYSEFKPSELGIQGDDSNRIYLKSDTLPSNITFYMNDIKVKNSKIFIGKNISNLTNSKVRFQGSRGLFYLGDNTRLSGSRIYLSDNDAYVCIGNGVNLIGENNRWITGSISKNTSTGIIAGESTLRSSDEHIVVDLVSNKQINKPHTPVIIEPYCWFGQRTTILKNCRIGACSISAFGAVVTKSCDTFSLLGGVPAKPKNIYGKLWLRNEYSNAKKVYEIYKKRFISGADNDNY